MSHRRLRKAASMPDDRINFGDPNAPLMTSWDGAIQGKFFRPIKRLKSFRIDEDVLAYFEGHGKDCQTMVNRVLREAMLRDLRNDSGSQAPVQGSAGKT